MGHVRITLLAYEEILLSENAYTVTKQLLKQFIEWGMCRKACYGNRVKAGVQKVA